MSNLLGRVKSVFKKKPQEDEDFYSDEYAEDDRYANDGRYSPEYRYDDDQYQLRDEDRFVDDDKFVEDPRVSNGERFEDANELPPEGGQTFGPVVGPGGVVGRPRPNRPGRPNRPPSPNRPPRPHPNRPPSPNRPPRPQPGRPRPGDGANDIPSTPATRSGRLIVDLRNDSTSDQVYAYITGQAIDNNNALFLLSADGQTPVYPASPSSTGQRISQNISIELGPPGNVRRCRIPRLAGGRIWFSIGAPLVFAVNPGPGLVEPSVFNQQDPNINVRFGFAEFTFNNAQVFANISYVDFVGLPIAMTLEDTNRRVQHVSGMRADGLQTIAQGLKAQTQRDGRRWSSLIVGRRDGQILRILSPNSAILLNPTWFQDYWTQYVNQVYGRFTGRPIIVDTQAQFGDVQGRSTGAGINFGSGGNFPKPTARDIFSCSTGPFATGQNAQTNTIIPRLAAAFNRSTLLLTDNHPDGVGPRQYYQNPTTNVSHRQDRQDLSSLRAPVLSHLMALG